MLLRGEVRIAEAEYGRGAPCDQANKDIATTFREVNDITTDGLIPVESLLCV